MVLLIYSNKKTVHNYLPYWKFNWLVLAQTNSPFRKYAKIIIFFKKNSTKKNHNKVVAKKTYNVCIKWSVGAVFRKWLVSVGWPESMYCEV